MKLYTAMFALLCSSAALAEVNIYGPGGPHTALLEVAKAYKQSTGNTVNVHFGPQATWNEKAKANADILFGSSEQSALAIAADHAQNFSEHAIVPLYLRPAIILVKKGNPKNIHSLLDLAKEGVGVVVPEGSGKSNTSGTGVWEDMVGRTGNVANLQAIRKNIVGFVPNSGSARKMFQEDPRVDAWITWLDWSKSNPDFGEAIAIEPQWVVYRDFNYVLHNKPSDEARKFADYLNSAQAEKIFNQFGWQKQF